MIATSGARDREYREDAEKRKLRLENLEREDHVLAGRIKMAKELGATKDDLAPLLNELVFRPLEALDRHQDKRNYRKRRSAPPSRQNQALTHDSCIAFSSTVICRSRASARCMS